MSEWIKIEKRARSGLADECSVRSTGISIGKKHAKRLKAAQSVDVYRSRLKPAVIIAPRDDDEGYMLRIRGPGVGYLGTRKLVEQLKIALGRYPAKWVTEKLDGEERTILLIDAKAKPTAKKKY